MPGPVCEMMSTPPSARAECPELLGSFDQAPVAANVTVTDPGGQAQS